MNWLKFVHILFDSSAVINIMLAAWGLFSWGRLFLDNHTKFRWLYLLWILVSIVTGILYAFITLNDDYGMSFVNVAPYMILIRPVMTLTLASSSVTAEVMRYIRIKMKQYDGK